MKNRLLTFTFTLLLMITSSFLLVACSNEESFKINGEWNGVTTIQKNIDIICEEYETLSGEYLGKKSTYFNNIYIVDNVVKDLYSVHDGLVERSTRQYLGDGYTYTYVLKDKTTNEILFNSENVSYYENNACYNKETKKLIGVSSSSYEKTYYEEIYVVNNIEYSSNEVSCVSNAYFDNNTGLFLGQKYDFKEERTYFINNRSYKANEVYELEWKSGNGTYEDWFSGDDGGCFVERESLYCYKTNEVVRSSGYKYQTNNNIYPNNQVKQIKRNCTGQEITNIKAQFGDNYAEIKCYISTTYNYEDIKNLTFQSEDSQQACYYRGQYGELNKTIFFNAQQYSYNGNDWYSYDNNGKKFEFKISDKTLLFTDKSDYGYGTIYQDIILNK